MESLIDFSPSLFFLKPPERYKAIIKLLSDTKKGLTYEKVAMAHIPEILRAIGMDRILTEYYSWRSRSSDPGAQIDLIIDRADGFLNICEVKYSKGDYTLTKTEADKIDNRISAFQQETGTNKNILITLITVKPVKENAWTDTVSSFVSLQDLFG